MGIALLLILFAISFSHEEMDSIEKIHSNPWEYLGIPSPIDVIYLSILIFTLAIFYAIFIKNTSEQAKKIIFGIIVVPIIISTLYLTFTTVYLNTVSESEGPVHWHADFEIWACGVKYDLIDPTGFDNKVGSPVLHEHNDNRIHVEGVLIKKQEASLKNFFTQVGGNFDEKSLTLPTNEGVFTWSNGDKCNGKIAKWHVFVNNQEIDSKLAHDYVLSPHSITRIQGGEGDIIKLVFSEKTTTYIEKELGVEP